MAATRSPAGAAYTHRAQAACHHHAVQHRTGGRPMAWMAERHTSSVAFSFGLSRAASMRVCASLGGAAYAESASLARKSTRSPTPACLSAANRAPPLYLGRARAVRNNVSSRPWPLELLAHILREPSRLSPQGHHWHSASVVRQAVHSWQMIAGHDVVQPSLRPVATVGNEALVLDHLQMGPWHLQRAAAAHMGGR
jgi:hypothetical protein